MGMASQNFHVSYLANSILVEKQVWFGLQFSKLNSYGHPVSADVTDHLVFRSMDELMQA